MLVLPSLALNNLLFVTFANATQLSNQSTFKAACATWLSNHNTYYGMNIQLELPSLVLSILNNLLITTLVNA